MKQASEQTSCGGQRGAEERSHSLPHPFLQTPMFSRSLVVSFPLRAFANIERLLLGLIL